MTMKKLKRLVCLALSGVLLLFAALAEEEAPSVMSVAPEAVSAPDATAEPTSADAGEEKQSEAGAGDTGDRDTQAAPEDETDPTSPEENEAAIDDATDPTESEASPEPSASEVSGDGDADEAPAASPTDAPEAAPTEAPDAGTEALVITVEASEGVEVQDDVYSFFPMRPATLTFSWSAPEDAASHAVSLTDSQGVVLDSAVQAERIYVLDLAQLPAEQYTFAVEVTLQDGAVLKGAYRFVLASDGQGPRGGRGGGHGGGSRGGGASGGMSDGNVQGAIDQGPRITPGEALTDTHASGDRSMLRYSAVELEASGESMSRLVLGGTALDVMLGGGEETFRADIEGRMLVLTSQGGGQAWTLNGLALRRLSDSGIDLILLNGGDWSRELLTQMPLRGEVYARLRAEGHASSSFDYVVSEDGVRVRVDGTEYVLDDGALIPTEG